MSKRTTYYSLRSFFSYLKGYKIPLAFVFFSFVIANLTLAIIPVFVGKLIGTLATTPIDQHRALTFAWILVACSVGHQVSWHASELLYLKYLQPIGYLYENIVFKHVIQKPYHFFVDKFTGKVSSYIGMLGEEMRNFVSNIMYNYTNELVKLVTISVVLLSVNLITGAIFILGLVLMFLTGKYTVRKSIKYEKLSADIQSTKTGHLVDSVANFVNVKSFRKEWQEISSIERQLRHTSLAAKKSSLWNMFFWGSMGLIVRTMIWPATILLNVYLFLNGKLSIADFTTFMTSILLFSDFVWGLIWNISQFNLKLARIEEAYQYLFGPVDIVKDQRKTRAQNSTYLFKKELDIRNLNFAYPDKSEARVLSDISITIKKGEKLGVVGKSGGGKTTLAKLLLGYYDARSDELWLDGQSISTNNLSELVAFVPQDTALFHRSIADNIAYATDKKTTRADIVKAAKQAHADEFISQISDGYDALVGERGVKLSAGQRQRIAIARAFLDDKPILILDEATSALDSESEVLVQQALELLWENKTVIAIAHRLSTLRHMDRIIVMDQGRIVESGNHEELIKQKGKYAKLWAHQSGGFLDE